MSTFDGEEFGANVVGAVKGYLERKVTPLIERIEHLEHEMLLIEQQLGVKKQKPRYRVPSGRIDR
ncbi:hypothetical protein SAMN05428967_2224 [Phyllobacterium sp. YR620]|uniref:hypothetical protein n=1 Tax=Phyllobacterium sp. YR620 TaxID=1881066 RepID=UPI00088133C5|nr:hypothetical protein [Phyllobacterium sp. YR620]SDP46128.1 hypothetical protein SAMN05428967_2224 [Phyllobacterium sp. YR620]